MIKNLRKCSCSLIDDLICYCERRAQILLVIANIFRTISTTFYQNRSRFVDDVTMTLGVFWGSRLNYCIANLFWTMCTKFYQNRLGFVEDMTKTF